MYKRGRVCRGNDEHVREKDKEKERGSKREEECRKDREGAR